MSDPTRNLPTRVDHLPGEKQLAQWYQAVSKEQPPPGLDATILDAARQAARQQPRRIYFLTSRTWVTILSLAAALIMTIGVVRTLRHEIAAPGSTLHAPALLQSPVATRSDERVLSPPQPQEQKRLEATEAPAVMESPTAVLGKTSEKETNTPLPVPSGRDSSVPDERQKLRDAARLQSQQPQTVPLPAQGLSTLSPSPTKEEGVTSASPASGSPFVQEGEVRSQRKGAFAKKGKKSPEEWIGAIQELRRTGKYGEAEASLRAFKQHYPEYPIEKVLTLPPTSHPDQRSPR